MTSKINGLDASRPASSGGTGRVSQRSARTSASSPDSTATGEIHITDTASQLAALEQALRDLPPVDEARVAQLQSQIDQGTYQVAAEQVAERLTQFEQSLNALPKSGA